MKATQPHIPYLEALLQVEAEKRDQHAIANRTREAQLPRLNTIEDPTSRTCLRLRRESSANCGGPSRTAKSHLVTGSLSGSLPEEAASALHDGGGARQRTWWWNQAQQSGAAHDGAMALV